MMRGMDMRVDYDELTMMSFVDMRVDYCMMGMDMRVEYDELCGHEGCGH